MTMAGPVQIPADRELWRQAAAGDRDAFGEIFDRHSDSVYNHLFRRLADWSEAEDLTSAVFLQAWRRRTDVVIDRESVLPWLLGIANNVLRNTGRAKRRCDATLSRLGWDVLASASCADPADETAARLDDERRMADLRVAVDRLPRHEREVIELCVWGELDQQAAAVTLGVAVGTVKSRLHRARARLAAQLTGSRLTGRVRARCDDQLPC
jgi:RNA polymerase sigma factor (sigma-70 family)